MIIYWHKLLSEEILSFVKVLILKKMIPFINLLNLANAEVGEVLA